MVENGFRVIRSNKITVLARSDNQLTELFQIVFHKNSRNQEAFLVTFPYFIESKGIVSKLTFPGGTDKVDSLSLEETGSLTSHLVKYTHWEDGNTHFSQDAKVYTSIRNRASSLNVNAGHIFSIQLQGLSGFTKRSDLSKNLSKKRTDIDFAIKDDFEGLKFTGWWFDTNEMSLDKKVGGPQMQMKLKDGSYKLGFALSPVESKFPETFLFLSCELMPLLNKTDKSILAFIGGFDKSVRFENDASFLSFIYPVTNYKQLLKKISTIDLPKME